MLVKLLKSGGTGTAVYKRYGISTDEEIDDVVIDQGKFLHIKKYFMCNELVAFALEEDQYSGTYKIYEVIY
jgi:hypothetical protein